MRRSALAFYNLRRERNLARLDSKCKLTLTKRVNLDAKVYILNEKTMAERGQISVRNSGVFLAFSLRV